MGAIVSHFRAVKAAKYFHQAVELEQNGNLSEALSKARKGLQTLSLPIVDRSNPAAEAALAQLTLFVEFHAPSQGQAGASEEDLTCCHLYLGKLHRTDPQIDYSDWLEHIEKKLGYVPEGLH